jgi:hypothetical protein
MASDPTPLSKKHQTLLGKKPTKKQLLFYKRFPEFRGISDKSLDPEILEALFVAALTSGKGRDRAYILAPVAHEAWVMEQFNKTADIMFAGCKKWPNPVKIAKGYGQMLKKIMIVGRLLQIPEEPPYWVSFGFTLNDPIPDWVKDRLSFIDVP